MLRSGEPPHIGQLPLPGSDACARAAGIRKDNRTARTFTSLRLALEVPALREGPELVARQHVQRAVLREGRGVDGLPEVHLADYFLFLALAEHGDVAILVAEVDLS